jgi:hypothetical protein
VVTPDVVSLPRAEALNIEIALTLRREQAYLSSICKLVHTPLRRLVMPLRFIGVDPDSPNNGSPTIWLDEEDDSIVIQGWKVTDDSTISEITATGPIPDHETVVRLPARMAPFLLEVCGDDGTGGVRPAPLG